ncbi:MAG: HD family hydrolase, partial [Pseudomonadota bacterium]
MAKPQRAWQRMLSGRRLDLLDPTPMDIEIEDIAHGLAFVARWNGQTMGDYPYSVAEHSLLVEEIFTRQHPDVPAKWQLAALLHDAPEYVIGDMISPVKAAVGPGYGALDDRLAAAVHIRFGLPAETPKWI